MTDAFVAPDATSRCAMEQAAVVDTPVAPRLDDERLREIVRIVRATLEAEKPKEEEKSLAPLWKRAGAFCLEHWALTAFVASVIVLIGAAVGYRASPFYWFKQIAVADAELDRKQAKFAFDQKMADRQIQLGESFLDVWRLKDAAKAFDDALALDPTSVPASFGRFKANMFAEAAPGAYDPEVTERRLRRILDIDPKDPHALAALGEYFYFQDNWDKAREYYHQALAKRPFFAQALFGLGMVELKNKKRGSMTSALAFRTPRPRVLSPRRRSFPPSTGRTSTTSPTCSRRRERCSLQLPTTKPSHVSIRKHCCRTWNERGYTSSRATLGSCAAFLNTWLT